MKMRLITYFRLNLFFFVIFPLIQVFSLHASPFLSDTSKALEERLVQSMGAEEDVVTPSLEAIHGYLQTHPEEYDDLRRALTPNNGPLAVRWQKYQPEVFLQRIQVLRQEAYDDFITDSDASPNHPFLGQLQGFMALFDSMGHLPFFQETYQKLRGFYRGYLDILCALPARDRMDFLKHRAMVFTESRTAYRLDQKTARALVSRSAHGFPLRSNASGNHLVVGHEGFHYKADDGRAPLTPSFEFLFSLADQLWRFPDRPLASSSAFLHFHQVKINELAFDAEFTNWYHESPRDEKPRDDEDFAHYLQNHPGFQPRGTETVQSYAIQASQTIQGESVEDYFTQHPVLDPSVFDGDHFGMQIVLSLLLRPYDAKADNFLLVDAPKGKRFVGIDNDCLLTSRAYQFQGHHYPGVRNILYTLAPLMKDPFSEDFKQHIQSLPSTLPWTFLVGLFEKRKVYEGFAEHIGLSEEARQTYELAFHLRPGDFVDILETWRAIQSAVGQPRTITYEDLFHAVDPLTFSIYQALASQYGGHSQRIMEALYLEAERTRLESIREHLASGTQKTYDQGHWPKRDERREGRTRSLENSFLEGWQSSTVKDFSLEDIISFSQELVRLKSILHETQWKPFLSKIKDSWPQEGLLADPTFPFRLFKNNAFDPECIDLWTQDLLKHLAFTDEEGQTLLHVLLSHRPPDVIEKISLRPFRGLVNRPTPFGLTPLDLMAQGYHSVFTIESLLALGAWDVRDPQGMADYIQTMGREREAFAPWAWEFMNRTPQVRWHVMLNDLLPSVESAIEGREIRTTHLGLRTLSKAVEDRLFNHKGIFQQANKSGRREVGYVPWQGEEGLWFKIFPELPGREEMARILCLETLTAGILPFPLIPPSMLLRVPYEGPWQRLSKEKLPCVSVLVSQGLGNQTFQQALDDDPQCHKRLDPESLSWLMVLTLLLNPEDGKPDNYVIQPHPTLENRLVLCSVDNDRLLAPPVALEQKEGWFRKRKTLQVKSIVYCLDQMKERLDPTFVKALLGLDARGIITQWMEKIVNYDDSLEKFFDQDDICTLQKKNSHLFAPFDPKEIPSVYRKLAALQDLLEDRPNLPFLQILMRVEPLLGKRYAQVLEDEILMPMERFRKVDGEAYSSVMKSLFQTIVTGGQKLENFMSSIVTRRENLDVVHSTSRQTLEEFQAYLQEEQAVFNLGNNENYEGEDTDLIEIYLAKHSWPNIPQKNQQALISKMRGKSFRTLKLSNCHNITMEDFKTLDFSILSVLDVSGCRLDDYFIALLSEKCSTLVELDVSRTNIKKFSWIEKTSWLRLLETDRQKELKPFWAPSLITLNAQGCTLLESIEGLYAPKLENLSVGSLVLSSLGDFSLPKLKNLDIDVPKLDHLGKLDTPSLEYLFVNASTLSDIKNFSCQNLKKLHIEAPQLQSICGLCAPNLEYLSINAPSEEDVGAECLKNFGINYINSPVLTSISDFSLQKLKSLRIDAPKLDHLGKLVTPSLEYLFIKSSTLGHIEDFYLTILENLHIEAPQLQSICRFNLFYLKDLSINAPYLRTISGFGGQYLKSFNINTRYITHVHLPDMGLNDFHIVNNELQKRKCNIRPNGLMVLSSLNFLSALHLSEANLDDAGVCKFMNLSNLRSLALDRNGITSRGLSFLNSLENIEELDLSHNFIGGIEAKTEAFCSLSKLRILNLGSNNIQNENLSFLTYLRQLKKLSLQGNSLGKFGNNFVEIFTKHHMIEILDLRNNSIIGKDLKYIVNFLELRVLYLEGNFILGNTHFRSLTNLSKLTCLNLAGNLVDDTGIEIISSMNSITNLDLRYNSIKKAGNLLKLTQLQYLDLGGNDIRDGESLKLLSEKIGNDKFNVTYESLAAYKRHRALEDDLCKARGKANDAERRMEEEARRANDAERRMEEEARRANDAERRMEEEAWRANDAERRARFAQSKLERTNKKLVRSQENSETLESNLTKANRNINALNKEKEGLQQKANRNINALNKEKEDLQQEVIELQRELNNTKEALEKEKKRGGCLLL